MIKVGVVDNFRIAVVGLVMLIGGIVVMVDSVNLVINEGMI